jgi:hypothetical protein
MLSSHAKPSFVFGANFKELELSVYDPNLEFVLSDGRTLELPHGVRLQRFVYDHDSEKFQPSDFCQHALAQCKLGPDDVPISFHNGRDNFRDIDGTLPDSSNGQYEIIYELDEFGNKRQ